MQPGYVSLLKSGVLRERAEELKQIYRSCVLCPRKCNVNRTAGQRGTCKSGDKAKVASCNSHTGEEPPISGKNGSGTVFLSNCTGQCVFCQNYPISQFGTGYEKTDEELADNILELQHRGCHNINFVTPTHFVPSIVGAIHLAAEKGLVIPIVYNTSGYENVEIVRMLEGIVDIYLPDIKYDSDEVAKDISGFIDYKENNRSSVLEMFRQTGQLETVKGIARKGVIIRHLILPGNLSGTESILKYIAEYISKEVYISLMAQYFPAWKAIGHNKIGRRITQEEYDKAIGAFHQQGLQNGWIQEYF